MPPYESGSTATHTATANRAVAIPAPAKRSEGGTVEERDDSRNAIAAATHTGMKQSLWRP